MSNVKSELWVDLEGTIIPHWNYMDDFINMDKFDKIFDEIKPSKIVIFSYAIWSPENCDTFKASKLYAYLNGKAPVYTLTTQNMEEKLCHMHQHMSRIPDRTIWYVPKEFSFLASVRSTIERGSDSELFVLFDDTAPHGLSYSINGKQTVKYYNPENM